MRMNTVALMKVAVVCTWAVFVQGGRETFFPLGVFPHISESQILLS